MPRYEILSEDELDLSHGGKSEREQLAEIGISSQTQPRNAWLRVSTRDAYRRRHEANVPTQNGMKGLTIADVVEASGRSEGTVRTALSRVEKRLGEKAPRRAGPRTNHKLDQKWSRLLKAELDQTPVRRSRNLPKFKKK